MRYSYDGYSLAKVAKMYSLKHVWLILSLLFLVVHGSIAQNHDPFAHKKKRNPDTDLEKRLKPLNFSKNSASSSLRSAKRGAVDFQIKRPLTLQFASGSYDHIRVNSDEGGLPIFIKSEPLKKSTARTAGLDLKTLSYNYLNEVKPLIQIEKPDEEFEIKNIYTDRQGQTHVRMQQMYNGVKVYGKEIILHLKNNSVNIFNGQYTSSPIYVNTDPLLTENDAQSIALSNLSTFSKISPPNRKVLGALDLSAYEKRPELVIYSPPGSKEMKLVWHATVFPNILERWEYFIDAHTGGIVNKYNHTCSIDGPGTGNANDLNGVAREVNTFIVSDVHYLIDASKEMFNEGRSVLPDNGVGVIMTLDLQNEPLNEETSVFHVTSLDNSWTDASAISAHYNAEVAYEYFLDTFGRNSINGEGGNILSIVNVADDDGEGLDNAFWNGIAMFYGNGNVGFSPLAGALDVGGHEMSHGVISNTANLEYQDQSGAINESFADIFGAMIDREDWLLGEDVVTNLFPSGALRSLEDPHNGGTKLGDRGFQPKHMTEIYTGPQDNGGVHINSGIPNHAFFLFATEVGKDIAEQVYYRALTVYLTASSQFIDLRLAVIQSAEDLHGESSPEVQAAKDAFDAVGIFDDEPTNQNPELPPLEGDDLVLFYNLDPFDPTTLYIYDVQQDGFQNISTTDVLRKPTITDDGSLAVFVKTDNTMNAIELSPPYEETEISPDPIWANISISKDGTKIAAISNEEDGNIYVYDLESEDDEVFALYNPTTAEGVQTGEVLFADAIEWDYTGQYLMYDALNAIQNSSGDDIEYWDVGFIRVWDNETNSFGDGSIQKLFTSLPEGISIGNPSFARNSPNVVVFDMVDENEDAYYVLAANIETNDIEIVFENQKIGYPNYSRLDDAIVFDAFDTSDEIVVAIVEMESDKITPAGSPTVFIEAAKWAQWFTQGTRKILSDEKELLSFDFLALEDETEVVFNGNEINVKVPAEVNLTALTAKFSHSQKAFVRVGDIKQISGVTKNDFSDPVVYTVIAEDGSSKNYTINVSHVITGIEDNKPRQISLYPNPVSGNLSVSFKSEGTEQLDVEIIDAYGRSLANYSFNIRKSGENVVTVPFRDILPGTYFVRMTTENGRSHHKIVKN